MTKCQFSSIGVSAGIGTIYIVSCFRKEQIPIIKVIKKNTKDNQYVKAFLINQGSLALNQYTFSEIEKITNSFRNKLDQGGYGSIYKGVLLLLDGRLVAVKVISELKGGYGSIDRGIQLDGCLVAVKVMSELKGTGSLEQEFINEVVTISGISYVNIVTFLGYCNDRTKRALVYEFMSNGSLDKFIYNQGSLRTNLQLEQNSLFQIVVDIA